MPHDAQAVARQILQTVPTLTLATADEQGSPHAANLNFVADDAMRLYWLSGTDSAHSRHIAARPAAAAALYPPFTGPETIKGLQIHGDARLTATGDFDGLWALFCGKFPYAAPMEPRARTQRFYVLEPAWVRLIDNAVGFGFKAEWRPDPAR